MFANVVVKDQLRVCVRGISAGNSDAVNMQLPMFKHKMAIIFIRCWQ